MIDFSKIKEDEQDQDDDVFVSEIDDFYKRIALPKCEEEADPSWRALSLCILYPSVDFFDGNPKSRSTAKSICFECTVREQCLQFALDNKEEFGVWGGTDGSERKILLGRPPRKRYPSRV